MEEIRKTKLRKEKAMILRNAPTEIFLASQALYGIMIAYPKMKEDCMVEKAFRLAEKMMEKSKQYTKKEVK